jgi:GntR family transcriptional regulator, arabinose operon transcriptional repressor
VSITQTPRIFALADRLVEDIRQRKLEPGDRYLSTADASKLLGISNVAANRALQLLEKRRIIVRRQRMGAVIAEPPPATEARDVSLHRVHLLVHRRYFQTEGCANDGVLIGIQEELPGCSVAISFFPPGENETVFADELVAESLQREERDGFVLVRASFDLQRRIAGSGLPAVVFGTRYPSVKRIPAITRDSFQIGRVLAEHHIAAGHRRIIYMPRQTLFSGDYETFDGIQAALRAAGFGLDSVVLRAIPSNEEVAEAAVAELLRHSTIPTGVICRNAKIAAGAERAATAVAGLARDQVGITVCDYYLRQGEQAKYAYARPELSAEGQGRLIGRALLNQALGRGDEPLEQRISVTLFIPPGHRSVQLPTAAPNGVRASMI